MPGDIETTGIPVQKCPDCGRESEAASNLHGRRPSEGALSVCINCACVMTFGPGLILRRSTLAERSAAPQLEAYVKAVLLRGRIDGG